MEFTYTKTKPPEKAKPAEGSQTEGAGGTAAVAEVPTADQAAEQTRDLWKTMGWGDPPPEALKPVEPVRAEPEPAAAPTATPATAPVPVAAEPEPEPEPSTSQIITRAAKETAREVASALRPPEPKPEPAPELDLSVDDRKDLEVLRYLERTNPKKYGGMVQATLDYFRKYYAYVQQWTDANPDKTYNPDEEPHAAWISENQPAGVSRDEIEEAKIDMRVEQKFEREIKPKFDAQEADLAFKEKLPTIGARIDTAIKQMVRQVDPQLADLLKDASGNEVLSNETIAKLDEADPIARDIIDAIVANELEPMILELEKTMIPEMNFKLEPKRNPIHRQITQFVAEKERSLASAPASQRTLDGKRWVSLNEYSRMVNQIQAGHGSDDEKSQSIRDLDDSVWCLDADQIKELMVDYCSRKAQVQIQKQDGLAVKKYGTARNNGGGQGRQPTPQPQNQPPATSGKPRPPSLGAQSVSVSTPISSPPGAKSYGEAATDVMFNR